MSGNYRKETARVGKLSADARILVALIKNQPLTKEEICKNSKIDESTFYRALKRLANEQIVKEVKQQYTRKYVIAIGGFIDALVELDEFLRSYTKDHRLETASLLDLANLIGKPPRAIEDAAYTLSKKYHFKIGSNTYPPLHFGPGILELYNEKDKKGKGHAKA